MDPGTRKRLGLDPYTASIELSNACRRFYQNRLEMSEDIKAHLLARSSRGPHDTRRVRASRLLSTTDSGDSVSPTWFKACPANDANNNNEQHDVKYESRHGGHTVTSGFVVDAAESRARHPHDTSVDHDTHNLQISMDLLRHEMVSLMDQDLLLMKQLLTLNDAIEELKLDQRYGYTSRSNAASYSDFSDSDLVDSEADLSRSCSPSPAANNAGAEETTADLSFLIREYDVMLQNGRIPAIPANRSPRFSPLVPRAGSNRLEIPNDARHIERNSLFSGLYCDEERVLTV